MAGTAHGAHDATVVVEPQEAVLLLRAHMVPQR
jgi:hypothetical protein